MNSISELSNYEPPNIRIATWIIEGNQSSSRASLYTLNFHGMEGECSKVLAAITLVFQSRIAQFASIYIEVNRDIINEEKTMTSIVVKGDDPSIYDHTLAFLAKFSDISTITHEDLKPKK